MLFMVIDLVDHNRIDKNDIADLYLMILYLFKGCARPSLHYLNDAFWHKTTRVLIQEVSKRRNWIDQLHNSHQQH